MQLITTNIVFVVDGSWTISFWQNWKAWWLIKWRKTKWNPNIIELNFINYAALMQTKIIDFCSTVYFVEHSYPAIYE